MKLSLLRPTFAVAVLIALSLPSRDAAAQTIATPTGTKGTLAIDQISGFRASAIGGISYAGPIGVVTQRTTATRFDNGLGGGNPGEDATRFTTFWISPTADYFVIDHLSVGGLVEVSTTSASIERINNNGTTQTTSLPTTTNFALLPRVGYIFGIGERFAIWPRGGLGYAAQQSVTGADTTAVRASTYGFIVDLDVGFLYRLTNNFFLRAAPELVFSLGASHATTIGGTTVSANASVFQFSVPLGIGVFFDL